MTSSPPILLAIPVDHVELPILIKSVQAGLASLQPTPVPATEPRKPAVPVTRSVFRDHIVCLEDGRRFKTLKRHLRTAYGLTPDEYRARWGLPHDYPVVAPAYAASRAVMARENGLGSGTGSRWSDARGHSCRQDLVRTFR